MSEEKPENELDAEVAGQKLRLKGYRIIDVIMLIGAVAFVGSLYLVYQDFKLQRVVDRTQTTAEHEHLSKSVDSLKEATNEQTYVLTLKQEDREKLNLSMPWSLRQKVYDDLRRPAR